MMHEHEYSIGELAMILIVTQIYDSGHFCDSGGGLKDKAGELSTGNIKALIQALPQFREVLSRLSLHIQVGRLSMRKRLVGYVLRIAFLVSADLLLLALLLLAVGWSSLADALALLQDAATYCCTCNSYCSYYVAIMPGGLLPDPTWSILLRMIRSIRQSF